MYRCRRALITPPRLRPELHILRDILMHKYGREFSLAVMENKDGCVSERVRPRQPRCPLFPLPAR